MTTCVPQVSLSRFFPLTPHANTTPTDCSRMWLGLFKLHAPFLHTRSQPHTRGIWKTNKKNKMLSQEGPHRPHPISPHQNPHQSEFAHCIQKRAHTSRTGSSTQQNPKPFRKCATSPLTTRCNQQILLPMRGKAGTIGQCTGCACWLCSLLSWVHLGASCLQHRIHIWKVCLLLLCSSSALFDTCWYWRASQKRNDSNEHACKIACVCVCAVDAFGFVAPFLVLLAILGCVVLTRRYQRTLLVAELKVWEKRNNILTANDLVRIDTCHMFDCLKHPFSCTDTTTEQATDSETCIDVAEVLVEDRAQCKMAGDSHRHKSPPTVVTSISTTLHIGFLCWVVHALTSQPGLFVASPVHDQKLDWFCFLNKPFACFYFLFLCLISWYQDRIPISNRPRFTAHNNVACSIIDYFEKQVFNSYSLCFLHKHVQNVSNRQCFFRFQSHIVLDSVDWCLCLWHRHTLTVTRLPAWTLAIKVSI